MQNHPVVRVVLKLSGNMVFNGAFNRHNVLSNRDASAVAKTEDMRIYGLRRLLEPHVQNHVAVLRPTPGRLSSAAREDGTSQS